MEISGLLALLNSEGSGLGIGYLNNALDDLCTLKFENHG